MKYAGDEKNRDSGWANSNADSYVDDVDESECEDTLDNLLSRAFGDEIGVGLVSDLDTEMPVAGIE